MAQRDQRGTSPDRKLADAVRTNPRMAPLAGQVLELLRPYAEAQPTSLVRWVEEFGSCTLPDGSSHRHGFVVATTTGIVLLWKQGFMWKGRGEHEIRRADATGWTFEGDTLRIETAAGTTVVVWREGSPELESWEGAFNRLLPLGRGGGR